MKTRQRVCEWKMHTCIQWQPKRNSIDFNRMHKLTFVMLVRCFAWPFSPPILSRSAECVCGREDNVFARHKSIWNSENSHSDGKHFANANASTVQRCNNLSVMDSKVIHTHCMRHTPSTNRNYQYLNLHICEVLWTRQITVPCLSIDELRHYIRMHIKNHIFKMRICWVCVCSDERRLPTSSRYS